MNCQKALGARAVLVLAGIKVMTDLFGLHRPSIVKKGWGKEIIFASKWPDGGGDKGYAGKILSFEKVGAEGSMHFHALKHETFYIHSGVFKLKYINTLTADEKEFHLKAGDVVTIPPNHPHKVICLEIGEIFEASTADSPSDSYRVQKGDSQKA
jgi:mannose-6-phosphate isomerase-like protein (cupin superfamily)